MKEKLATSTVMHRSAAVFGAVTFLLLAACGGNETPAADVTAPVAEAAVSVANPNIETAKQWVTAMNTGKAEGLAAVELLMADDGKLVRGRYVGFGFTWDPSDGEGRMIVGTVTPESPAAEVLLSGDEFVSVRGVEVNEANMDKLDFRGKPGEVVEAVILRDEETMEIAVARGVISTPISKAQSLEWMATGDGENWAPDKWELHEAVGHDNVVYVWTQSWVTDETSGLPVEAHMATRFVFNDAGQVTRVASLSEDRFALEQAGWTISR
jgi:hypothetical protein